MSPQVHRVRIYLGRETSGHVIPGPPVGQQGRKEQDRLTARQASGMNTDPRTISAIDCPMSPHSLHPACGVILAIKRSEEHTSELQSLMRISYAVFCLKKKKYKEQTPKQTKITK